METEEKPARAKPGPKAKTGTERFNVVLDSDVARRAMETSEGLSGLLRRLMKENEERQEAGRT